MFMMRLELMKCAVLTHISIRIIQCWLDLDELHPIHLWQ